MLGHVAVLLSCYALLFQWYKYYLCVTISNLEGCKKAKLPVFFLDCVTWPSNGAAFPTLTS